MNKDIKIIIVDDNPYFQKGIVSFLSKQERLSILAQFNSGFELIDFDELSKADIILMDIEMPGMNGLEAALRVNRLYPKMKIIALTMYQEKVYLNQLISSGFKGFVNKTEVPERLITTIDSVMNNKVFFPDNIKLEEQ